MLKLFNIQTGFIEQVKITITKSMAKIHKALLINHKTAVLPLVCLFFRGYTYKKRFSFTES
ncbi:hypothetical protein C7N43_02925 [Sphingobacteriales bacterium UPWRP_1]|nr:hypothetical protein BVG80_09430 [Sphingobacteriales bacterium TSM_CSM]PSJ78573.1 hypothetical protein C7N43_02925 [Sphingobacteriales bacterium UPWRP_1]